MPHLDILFLLRDMILWALKYVFGNKKDLSRKLNIPGFLFMCILILNQKCTLRS